MRDIGGIARPPQQVIGAGERNEAFRMLGRGENAAGIVDADGLVGWRVKDEQCLAQSANALGEILPGDIGKQGTADAERSADQRHLDFAFALDLVDAVAEQAGDMCRIERRGDRHHCARLGNAVRGSEHRGTAKAVTDQNSGCADRRPQMIRGGHQIVDVRRKGSVGELAFTGAEPGEIESQYGNAVQCQAVRNQARRLVVLAAGEAMRKQSDGADWPVRAVEQRGKPLTLGIGEIEAFGQHDC